MAAISNLFHFSQAFGLDPVLESSSSHLSWTFIGVKKPFDNSFLCLLYQTQQFPCLYAHLLLFLLRKILPPMSGSLALQSSQGTGSMDDLPLWSVVTFSTLIFSHLEHAQISLMHEESCVITHFHLAAPSLHPLPQARLLQEWTAPCFPSLSPHNNLSPHHSFRSVENQYLPLWWQNQYVPFSHFLKDLII